MLFIYGYYVFLIYVKTLPKGKAGQRSYGKLKDHRSSYASFFYEIHSTGGDKLTFHCHIKGKCHEKK